MITPHSHAPIRPAEILRLVTSTACVQCRATERALDAADIAFETIPKESLTDEQLTYLRSFDTQMPVVIAPNGDVWQGFRPDKIDELAERAVMPSDATGLVEPRG